MTVLQLRDTDDAEIVELLARYDLNLQRLDRDETIPGSYWGDSEAGLIADRLYARPDTPIHSILHETAHYVCMTPDRRSRLHRDAGGDDIEESAVCYLQILLADYVSCMTRGRMFQDMDAWGYSFRLGSTKRWFYEDADDAGHWLSRHGLMSATGRPSWKRRDRR